MAFTTREQNDLKFSKEQESSICYVYENLSRWSGIACIVAGLLMVAATLVHPSRETPEVIPEQELRLVAAHWFGTLSYGILVLGLPDLYAVQCERAGRLGLVSFLMLSLGTLLYAVSNNYGFIAPVLAAGAPVMLEAINAYPPVVTQIDRLSFAWSV